MKIKRKSTRSLVLFCTKKFEVNILRLLKQKKVKTDLQLNNVTAVATKKGKDGISNLPDFARKIISMKYSSVIRMMLLALHGSLVMRETTSIYDSIAIFIIYTK